MSTIAYSIHLTLIYTEVVLSTFLKELGLTTINYRIVAKECSQFINLKDIHAASDCFTTREFISMSAQVAIKTKRISMLNTEGFEKVLIISVHTYR